MKLLLSFLFLFLSLSEGFSQKNEFLKKKAFPITPSKKIEAPKPEKPEPKPENPFTGMEPVNPSVTDHKPAVNPNPFSNPAPMLPTKTIGAKPISMENKRPFANPGDKIVEKLNKKIQAQEGDPNVDYSVFRKNESFGEFRTKGEFVTLDCRDFGEVDGDKISLFVNGKSIQSEIVLSYEYKKFNINLEKGINKIEFLCINEGFTSPNTTQFVIYDFLEKILTGIISAKATGFKASIIIVRE